jgi:acyl carrier protein
MMDNELKLRSAFCDALGIGADTDFEALEYRAIKGWDSVAHMQLVAAIETVFDIMLEAEDVLGMSSYPKAREIVARYGVAF